MGIAESCFNREKAYALDLYSVEEALADLASILSEKIELRHLSGEQLGLYLATSNAGIAESVLFWRDALEASPRFANPQNFNWTLSNGPAGYLSRELNIQGPCYTMVGGSDAVEAAIYHLLSELRSGVVHAGILCGMDFQDEKLLTFSALITDTWKPGRAAFAEGYFQLPQSRYASKALIRFLGT